MQRYFKQDKERIKMAEEEDTEITSLVNISELHLQEEKHIYLWNSSHHKLTGSWQEDACTIKAARERRAWPERKGREVTSWRPMTLREESGGSGDPPWGASSQVTDRSPQPWSLARGR